MVAINQLYTKLESWRLHQFNPQVGIKAPASNAYIVQFRGSGRNSMDMEEFHALLQDPQASQLQALVCEIEYDRSDRKVAFGVVLEALCDAREDLPNLKALFIGDKEEHEFRKSKLHVFDIRPILEAYPNLHVLQVRGCFDEYELECKFLRHENLKTLIVETADLNNQNLAQICALELPELEYFELWLGRQLWDEVSTIDNMLPIIFGESFPNLSYLGLRSCEYTNLLVETVVQSPIIERLAVLDFFKGTLSDYGAEALLNCPAINRLFTLNIANNCVSPEMVQRLLQLNCLVIADSQEEIVDRGCSGARYSALHE